MFCIWLLASVLFVSKSNKNNSQFLQPPYFVEPFLLPHLPPKEQNFSASVFLYAAYWVFPESSRWLLANGRVEEAEDIVREIARWCISSQSLSWKICFENLNIISSLCHDLCLQRTNGRVLPAQWKLLPPSKRNCSDSSEGLNVDAGAQSWHQRHPFADGGSATSFFRLFTMPNMRRKTFICYYLWFRWRCNPSPFPSS